MPTALIIGGTGLIGRATARRLVTAGWDVTVTGRNPTHNTVPEARFVAAGRDEPRGPVDLLVDCICYTPADATALLPLAADAAATVMISSKGVYVDEAGNHTNSTVAPHFTGPITETNPTVAPGTGDHTTCEGYGPNKVAAEHVLLDSGHPVTILRPSKMHGPGAARPREWMYVKRVLDARPVVFLARRGEGIDHTTAAANTAALIETVAANPGRRILNSADPDAPSVRDIARTVAAHLNHQWQEIPLEDDSLGRSPWDAAHPIVLDTTASLELGYRPVGDYATTVAAEIDWLVDNADARPDPADSFFTRLLDYPAEDRYLNGGSGPTRLT